MGLAADIWKRHAKFGTGVEVRGKRFISVRKTGISILLNIQAREIDPIEIEDAIVKEWGENTLMELTRTRHILLEEPWRRDLVSHCNDTVDATIPLSCISLLHVLMQPCDRLKSKMQFQLNVYARSIHVEKLDEDLELLRDVIAWLLEPLEEFYWEDYDPVLNMKIADYHAEVIDR